MAEDQSGSPPTDSESGVQAPASAGSPPLPPLPPLSVPSFAPSESSAPPLGTSGTGDYSIGTTGPAPKGRAKLVFLLVAVVVLVGAIGGVFLMADNGPAPVAVKSPTEANADLYAAAMTSGSFHYVNVASGTDRSGSHLNTDRRQRSNRRRPEHDQCRR